MLLRRANRGARGKAATKMVMNPNWMTISKYSLKRSERSAGARPKSLTYPGAVSGSLAAPSWSSFSKFRPGTQSSLCNLLKVNLTSPEQGDVVLHDLHQELFAHKDHGHLDSELHEAAARGALLLPETKHSRVGIRSA